MMMQEFMRLVHEGTEHIPYDPDDPTIPTPPSSEDGDELPSLVGEEDGESESSDGAPRVVELDVD